MTLTKALLVLFRRLPRRRRVQLALLPCLLLAAAVAEVASLGAIVPFLAILSDPVEAVRRPMVASLIETLGLGRSTDLRWALTIMFSMAAVTAGIVRFLLLYATAKLNFGMGHELGAEMFRRTLYQPYEVHIGRNSSQIIGGLKKVDDAVVVVFGLLTAASAIFVSIFIIAMLILISPIIATFSLACFGGIYAAISTFTRKQLARNSEVINSGISTRVQCVQEGLGGIRDVLIDRLQSFFSGRFNQIDWPIRQAQASTIFISHGPRFGVESVGMVVLALVAYTLTTSGGGVAAAIPTVGALALGAQRLMPLLQQTYQGWANATANRQLLVDVAVLLQQPVPNQSSLKVPPFPFEQSIRIQKVSYRYEARLPLILNQLELAIPKGARIGLVGATGSGKSTLVDLLMGLLQPDSGEILVDGVPLTELTRLAWQRNIAHVPQAIFLADASFAENIAFGFASAQVDMARVRRAAQQAQLSAFIETSPHGYATMVGERGVRLSGGQRQRIGIARALYKDCSVLVLDEATSALDSDTESAVMRTIDELDRKLTMILISHRLSTLSSCDNIYRICEGTVVPAKAD